MGTGNKRVGHCTRRLPPTAPAATPATGHYAVSHVLLQYLRDPRDALAPSLELYAPLRTPSAAQRERTQS